MDTRRSSRVVIDPKIRQVGFVTPDQPSANNQHGAVSLISSSPPVSDISPGNSLSPVMIPPPRHTIDTLPSHVRTTAIPVLSPPIRSSGYTERVHRENNKLSESYKNDSIDYLENQMSTSSIGRVEKVSGSLPNRIFEGIPAKTSKLSVGGDLTIVSALDPLRGASDKSGALNDSQNDQVVPPKALKERTSKAERRALQEAQRAAKAAAKETGERSRPGSTVGGTDSGNLKHSKSVKSSPHKDTSPSRSSIAPPEKKGIDRISEKDKKKDVPHPRKQFDDKQQVEKAKRRSLVKQTEARNRVELFRHLPQYEHGTQLPHLELKFFQLDPMHPSIYKVGLQYIAGDISGGNARCIAMLHAFKDVIRDYSTPHEKSLIRDLTAKIGTYVSFLVECRPLSISMGNAIKFLKNRIAKLPLGSSESEAKSKLQSDIDRFINEKIILADKVIVRHAVTKINDGDVLLTYGYSSVIEMLLLHAHEVGKHFRIVIVDSRPKLEGRALLRRLLAKGLSCTYTHINAISYIMHEVTTVFLGASSILSNGTVYSRIGTACVSMVAQAFRIPVLVCCEAYKFHERVQLDSICSNELGDADAISKIPGRKDVLTNWTQNENLQLLNLLFDATPSEYVSMIVTDYGMVPPTSVPVIVREYRREQLWI